MTAPASIHPRPHMPAFSPPKFADSRLQRMYETGDYSDLIFVAGLAETFRVHKSIVCPASAWFRNACGTVGPTVLSLH